ncbi:MAG: beta-N-acetylhexosaminidase [Limisphaerales bacterium]
MKELNVRGRWRSFYGIWLAALTLSGAFCSLAAPSIIPLPVVMQTRSGVFTLCPSLGNAGAGARASRRIYVDSASSQTGQYLAMMLSRSTGLQFAIVTNNSAGPIRNGILLTTVNALGTLGTEGYELTVASDSVVVRAPAQGGVFYGVQSFLQCLPPQIMSLQPVAGINWTSPCVYIQDFPRFIWRGVMLDVSRHFFDKQEVEKLLDGLALHKINTFHWHLTDDHGWRIEIKSYPLLTSTAATNTAAWRTNIDYNLNPGTSTAFNSLGKYGGYYTQDDIREVVAYAAQRHITVVPEIEVPAHFSAALVSYPDLGCGNPDTTSFYDLDNTHFGFSLLSLAGPTSWLFVTNVLTEVMNLFPSHYIHCGGDEVVATVDRQWTNYTYDATQMSALGINTNGGQSSATSAAGVQAYQRWFTTNLVSFVSSKGRTLCGWSEIEDNATITNAVLLEWETDKGNTVASNGQSVVMCPNGINYYEISNANTLQYEPYFQVGNVPAYKTIGAPLDASTNVYNYEPVPATLNPPWTTNIIGAQLNLWTEFVPSALNVEYKMFPRICAEAEVTWTPAAQKNLTDFTNRLVIDEQRLAQMGMNYNRETNTQIGTWGPSVPTSATTVNYTITSFVNKAGEIDISFAYTGGSDGINIFWVALLENGVEINRSTFTGLAGAGLYKQFPNAFGGIAAYPLHLQVYHPGATYTIQASIAENGTHASSNGKVYMPNWN